MRRVLPWQSPSGHGPVGNAPLANSRLLRERSGPIGGGPEENGGLRRADRQLDGRCGQSDPVVRERGSQRGRDGPLPAGCRHGLAVRLTLEQNEFEGPRIQAAPFELLDAGSHVLADSLDPF